MSVQRPISRRGRGRLSGGAAALTLALALAGPARAAGDDGLRKPSVEPPQLSLFKIALPQDWTRNADLSATTGSDASHAGYFDAPYQSGADSFAPVDGLLFHVTWAGTLAPVEDPVAALRREVDREKQLWCGAGERQRLSWSESVDGNVASATLVWKNGDTGLVSRSRMLAYATPEKRARVVIAECVMRQDRQKDLDPLCQRVLATLEVRAETPAPLTALPASAVGDDCPKSEAPDVPVGAVESNAPRMGEAPAGAGKGAVLYTGEGDGGESKSNKWLMIAGGVLLVVAIYLTTRNRPSTPPDRGSGSAQDERPEDEEEGEGEGEDEDEDDSDDEGERRE